MFLNQHSRTTRRATRLLGTAALVTALVSGIAATFALTHQAAAAPAITFSATPTTESVGTQPSDVVTGDLGNGAQDIVETSDGNNATPITVLWNDGKGNFSTITPKDTGALASAVAIGDFNGDGQPDLVIGQANTSKVQILTGDGTGTFTAQTPIAIDGTPTALATGDFNGDGYSDIVVVYSTGSGGGVDVLLNDKSGGFSKTQLTFGVAGDGPNHTSAQAIAVGDLNGHQGIVTADQNGAVSVFLGNGDGTFHAEQVYPTTVGDLMGAVALAHLNGSNSRLDIVTADLASGNVTVLYNQGSGTFTTGGTYQVGANDEQSIFLSATDLNADGYTDLAATDGTSGTVNVLPGELDTKTGNTVFGTSQQVYAFSGGVVPGAISAADFTNNGLKDLAVLAGDPANQVDIFHNTSPAPTPGPQVTSTVTGGETINGTTYVTPSSIITFTANNASAISYRYYETSLGTPTNALGTSHLLAMHLGGAADTIPHNLGNFYLPYKTTNCLTSPCTTSTTITGTTSGGTVSITGPTLAAVAHSRIGAATRHVAGKAEVSLSVGEFLKHAALITGTPYTIQFYATGTNGSGSPATAQTIHVVLVQTLPSTTGLSGAGHTTTPATAHGAQQPPTRANGSTGSTGSMGNTGATSNNGNATSQQGQQTQQQATPAATTTSMPRLALVLAVLAALVLFALGGSLALAFSRRRKQ